MSDIVDAVSNGIGKLALEIVVPDGSASATAFSTSIAPEVDPASDTSNAADEVGTLSVAVYLPDGAGNITLDGVPVAADAAATVRALLADHPSACAFTSFRMDVEQLWGNTRGMRAAFNDSTDVTLLVAAAAAAMAASASDVSPLPAIAVHVIPEPYDVRRLRAHVRRLREVLLVRPPVAPCAPTATESNRGSVSEVIHKSEAGGHENETPDSTSAHATTSASHDDSQPQPQQAITGRDVAMAAAADASLTGLQLLMHVQSERSRVARAVREFAPVAALVATPAPGASTDLSKLVQPPIPVDPEVELARVAAAETSAAGGSAGNNATGMVSGLVSVSALKAAPASSSPASNTPAAALGGLPKCLESISMSGWNPPPAPRRMAGDLVYFRVETLEGVVLHVTGTAGGFFVARTTDVHFDPAPAQVSYSSRTMWTLLYRASPYFRKAYQHLLAHAASSAADTISMSASTFDATFALQLAPSSGQALPNGATSVGYVPLLSSGATGSGVGTESGSGSGSGFRTPAATYAIALPPAVGNFATSRPPWLVPSPNAAVLSTSSSLSAQNHSTVTTGSGGGGGVVAHAGAASGKKGGGRASSPPASANLLAHNHAAGGATAAAGGPLHSLAASGAALPPPPYTFDASRAEEDALATWGMDDRGALRDWNEEWQNVTALPSADLGQRVTRARACARVLSEFVDAATQGAIGIVGGNITPLNSAEDPKSHVWVYNGIFFSLALDAASKGEERRARAAARAAARITGATVPPGPLDDVASLASPNHDLQGVRALQRAAVPGLHTLATAVVGFAGTRLVAQSIIPGILQADTASHLVYGSADNGASIASEPRMHAMMTKAAVALRIAERTVTPLGRAAVLDSSQASATAPDETSITATDALASAASFSAPAALCGPVECKGILGSDGRLYCLDLVRMTPRDPLYYDARRAAAAAASAAAVDGNAASTLADDDDVLEGGGYTALLRPELLDAFDAFRTTLEGVAWLKTQGSAAAALVATTADSPATAPAGDALSSAETPVPPPNLAFNVNAFTRFARCMAPEVVAADEDAIRVLGAFLTTHALPGVFGEIRRASGIAAAGDGDTLTRLMHSRGINVRYLGHLCTLAATREAAGTIAPFVLELLETELVARVARRVLDALLRDIAACRAAPAITISAFFNALLGGAAAAEGAAAAATSSTSVGAGDDTGSNGTDAGIGGGAQVQLPLHPGGKKSHGGKKRARVAESRDSAGAPVSGGSLSASSVTAADSTGRQAQLAPPGGSTPPVAAPSVAGVPLSAVSSVVRTPGGLAIPVPRVSYPANDVPSVSDVARRALEAEGFCAQSLWSDISAGANAHFGYSLKIWGAVPCTIATPASSSDAPADATKTIPEHADTASSVSKPSFAGRRNYTALLRRVCQRVGIQLAARTYDFTTAVPVNPEDVQGFAPLVKSCMPSSLLPDANALITAGRAAAARGDLKPAFELVQESVQLLYSVAGSPAHYDMGDACSTLASIFWHAGDAGSAVLHQARALAVYTALCGADSLYAARAHAELGGYYAEIGAHAAAARHLVHATLVMDSAGPSSCPELAAAFLRLGTTLLDAHHLPGAIAALNEAVNRSRWDALTAGSALVALGLAYSLAGDFKTALQCARSAYAVFRDRGADAAPLAEDAAFWMAAFTSKAVELGRAASAAVNASSGNSAASASVAPAASVRRTLAATAASTSQVELPAGSNRAAAAAGGPAVTGRNTSRK